MCWNIVQSRRAEEQKKNLLFGIPSNPYKMNIVVSGPVIFDRFCLLFLCGDDTTLNPPLTFWQISQLPAPVMGEGARAVFSLTAGGQQLLEEVRALTAHTHTPYTACSHWAIAQSGHDGTTSVSGNLIWHALRNFSWFTWIATNQTPLQRNVVRN